MENANPCVDSLREFSKEKFKSVLHYILFSAHLECLIFDLIHVTIKSSDIPQQEYPII
jgi:hypothetical protein